MKEKSVTGRPAQGGLRSPGGGQIPRGVSSPGGGGGGVGARVALGGKWRELNEENTQMRQELTSNALRNDMVSSQCKSLQIRVETLEMELGEEGRERSRVESELEEVRGCLQKSNAANESLTKEKEELQETLERSDAMCTDLQTNLQRTEDARCSLRSIIEQRDKKLMELEVSNTSLTAENANMQMTVKKVEGDLAVLKKVREQKDKHIAVLLKEKTRLQTQLNHLRVTSVASSSESASGKEPAQEVRAVAPSTDGPSRDICRGSPSSSASPSSKSADKPSKENAPPLSDVLRPLPPKGQTPQQKGGQVALSRALKGGKSTEEVLLDLQLKLKDAQLDAARYKASFTKERARFETLQAQRVQKAAAPQEAAV